MVEVKQGEISLVDLWEVLVKQKVVIGAVWLVAVLLALAYVSLATPIYKVEAFLLPPSQKDIQPLNVPVLDRSRSSERLSHYESEDVYRLFIQSLKSKSVRRGFYESYSVAKQLGLKEGDNPDTFFEERFSKKLLVNQNVKKKEEEGFVSVSLEGEDPKLMAQWVNVFVEETANIVRKRLVGEVEGKVKSLETSVEDLILGKKTLAKDRREDRIIILQEALSVTQSLSEQDQQVKRLNSIAVNTKELPLYLLSPNALKAEIKVLKSRQDDAPFIKGLRDLEEKMASLGAVSIQGDKIKPFYFDQKAIVPEKPIKPKRMLIIILAGLMGFLLGVVVAFIRSAEGGASKEIKGKIL
ncbi:MAG: Wzz/FepE/Etk N-terminal domain-containing protein [Ghiorsea sp.]|nr:Wzz/FepE/Etk N-terminal domain-containing protein [Ghiorsea sp.]